MTYTQLFIRFLKQNNIYYLFSHNLHNNKKTPKNKIYKNIKLYDYKNINDLVPMNFFVNAFIWEDTKEGHDFWLNLHIKWLNVINEHLICENDYEKYIILYNLKGNDKVLIKENNK